MSANHSASFFTEITAAGIAPDWVHLIPSGEVIARDGRKFILDDAATIIQSFQQSNVDLAIDYEHQADKPVLGHAGPVPAAGWIKELTARNDGLWGRVEWTAKAAQMIRDREYRYLSPSMILDKVTKQIVRLKGAGLVHRPALHLTALASEEEPLDQTALIAALYAALGLPEDADPQTALDALKQKLGDGGDDKPDPAKFVPIEAMEDLLRTRNEGQNQIGQHLANAKVEDAIRQGIITPAMKGWATELCTQNPASFDAFLAKSIPVFGHLNETFSYMKDQPAPQFSDPAKADSEAAAQVCDQLGLSPDALN